MPLLPAVLGLLAPLILLLPAESHAEPPLPALHLQASQQAALGIVTQRLEKSTTAGERFAARVVVPQKALRQITAPVAGTIEMLAVSPGDSVRKGQVLAQLRSVQALSWQAAGQSAAAQAQLATETFERDKQLFAEGLIPESRLSASRAAARQAQASAAEQRLGMAAAGISSEQLGSLVALTAPIAGTVLTQDVQLGQRVDAASPLYQIGNLQQLALEIQLPLSLATQLPAGTQFTFVTPTGKARLNKVGRAVDAGSQSVTLRADVSEGSERLLPGQVIEVVAELPVADGIRLPASAVVRHGQQDIVFVVSGTEKPGYTARPVDILAQGGKSVTVRGLAAGETVVVSGASGLKALLQAAGQ